MGTKCLVQNLAINKRSYDCYHFKCQFICLGFNQLLSPGCSTGATNWNFKKWSYCIIRYCITQRMSVLPFLFFFRLFFFFFLMWTIFKVFYWICYNIASVLCFISLVWGMWNLSFLARDWTCTPCIGRQSLNHRTAREVLHLCSLDLDNGFATHLPCRFSLLFFCFTHYQFFLGNVPQIQTLFSTLTICYVNFTSL